MSGNQTAPADGPQLSELKLISFRLNLIQRTLVTIASILLGILSAICFSTPRTEGIGISLGIVVFAHFLYQGFRKQVIEDRTKAASRKTD